MILSHDLPLAKSLLENNRAIMCLLCCLGSLVRSRPHVMWLDNFSKTYGAAVQGILQGAYASCLWMGRGVKVYVGDVVDLQAENIPTGMPTILFTKTTLAALTVVMQQLDAKQWSYDDSYCVLHGIVTVPPKREVSLAQNPVLHKQLKEHRDGMNNFHPFDIIDSNPGKNEDLVRYFKKHHFDPLVMDPTLPVQVLMCDVNIYFRIVKVAQCLVCLRVRVPSLNHIIICP